MSTEDSEASLSDVSITNQRPRKRHLSWSSESESDNTSQPSTSKLKKKKATKKRKLGKNKEIKVHLPKEVSVQLIKNYYNPDYQKLLADSKSPDGSRRLERAKAALLATVNKKMLSLCLPEVDGTQMKTHIDYIKAATKRKILSGKSRNELSPSQQIVFDFASKTPAFGKIKGGITSLVLSDDEPGDGGEQREVEQSQDNGEAETHEDENDPNYGHESLDSRIISIKREQKRIQQGQMRIEKTLSAILQKLNEKNPGVEDMDSPEM